jgi:cleavage and polyadenylation specificity factor subunit 1
MSLLRPLCLLIETSIGDLYMYTAKRSDDGKLEFIRVPFNLISRTSKDEARHGTKLKRKKMSKDLNFNSDSFRKARLHRFFSISGQDGLFAATARPAWFVSERGAPYVLCHRLRYAAPAGGRALPMAGFCPDFKIRSNGAQNNCFLTLHERIGRVGSQRLTIFSNLSDVFGSYGLLPGGNIALEKIPLGVTVRKIVFIDDVSISSVTHPVYALLISRELDKDQSHLHDDGLHAIDRRVAKQEREKEKVRRQVEADLGGFDVEQEWVEDIERDDVFEVETRYGRAPTIPFTVYEIWVSQFFYSTMQTLNQLTFYSSAIHSWLTRQAGAL